MRESYSILFSLFAIKEDNNNDYNQYVTIKTLVCELTDDVIKNNTSFGCSF